MLFFNGLFDSNRTYLEIEVSEYISSNNIHGSTYINNATIRYHLNDLTPPIKNINECFHIKYTHCLLDTIDFIKLNHTHFVIEKEFLSNNKTKYHLIKK